MVYSQIAALVEGTAEKKVYLLAFLSAAYLVAWMVAWKAVVAVAEMETGAVVSTVASRVYLLACPVDENMAVLLAVQKGLMELLKVVLTAFSEVGVLVGRKGCLDLKKVDSLANFEVCWSVVIRVAVKVYLKVTRFAKTMCNYEPMSKLLNIYFRKLLQGYSSSNLYYNHNY